MMHDYLAIDVHFARLMCDLGATRDPAIYQLFAQLSQALRQQHSCIDLAQRDDTAALVAKLLTLPCVGQPDSGQWAAGAQASPLILERNKLYLQRYYQYECRIAAELIKRNQPLPLADPRVLRQIMTDQFGANLTTVNWQAVATLQALTRGLTVITGGPGTGKTTTVLKLLQAFAALPGNEHAIVKLAAPTGKAAMRLNQGLRQDQDTDKPVVEVQTLHRLLGMRMDGRSWRHDARHPLTVDLLIVDEVSMVDLAMMDRLLRALPAHCQLVLLGDPDQLPAVETGNFLMDICRYPAGYSAAFHDLAAAALGTDLPINPAEHKLKDALCRLTKSYRFDADQGIGQLARAIQQGGPIQGNEQVSIRPIIELQQHPSLLLAPFTDYLALAADTNCTAGELLDQFEQTRILSAVREGDYGVEHLNLAIEAQLLATGFRTGSTFYHGRPIMIMRNDYALGLFNGDVGICLFNLEDQRFHVAFRDSDGAIMTHLASRLPPHETCFVMTVHKSQGSEFNAVTLVLQAAASPRAEQLVSRELLYTAVTRSRQRIILYSSEALLNEALNTHARRDSGLAERFL
ncbi:MAG: exodeoxyribonuclease V subunit alpha [Pseudomonadales bacterium]|nr:exodeoxyribonuclease V subunit alpha [Pseudomonadales bacterium]